MRLASRITEMSIRYEATPTSSHDDGFMRHRKTLQCRPQLLLFCWRSCLGQHEPHCGKRCSEKLDVYVMCHHAKRHFCSGQLLCSHCLWQRGSSNAVSFDDNTSHSLHVHVHTEGTGDGTTVRVGFLQRSRLLRGKTYDSLLCDFYNSSAVQGYRDVLQNCRLCAILQYACEGLEVNPSSSSQEVCELDCFLHDLVNAKKKPPWTMCTLLLSLLRYEAANFLGLEFRPLDGPCHKLLIKELGQLQLDSGSLPAGWFPLPDAVGMLLGCHPSASRSLPSTSLEQLWDLGRLLYNYNAVTVKGD